MYQKNNQPHFKLYFVCKITIWCSKFNNEKKLLFVHGCIHSDKKNTAFDEPLFGIKLSSGPLMHFHTLKNTREILSFLTSSLVYQTQTHIQPPLFHSMHNSNRNQQDFDVKRI